VGAVNTTRRRNLEFERDVTHLCAKGVCDPADLIEHAESRAMRLSGEYVTDPMLVTMTRDRPFEAREELTDARNHLVWWLEDHLDDPEVDRKQDALRLIILAYQLLGDAE
jgi:hypothetical protein